MGAPSRRTTPYRNGFGSWGAADAVGPPPAGASVRSGLKRFRLATSAYDPPGGAGAAGAAGGAGGRLRAGAGAGSGAVSSRTMAPAETRLSAASRPFRMSKRLDNSGPRFPGQDETGERQGGQQLPRLGDVHDPHAEVLDGQQLGCPLHAGEQVDELPDL